MSAADGIENLSYDVFVNEWPQQTNGLLPNGEPKRFSPQASTSEASGDTDPQSLSGSGETTAAPICLSRFCRAGELMTLSVAS
jgi:hypothetical protein